MPWPVSVPAILALDQTRVGGQLALRLIAWQLDIGILLVRESSLFRRLSGTWVGLASEARLESGRKLKRLDGAQIVPRAPTNTFPNSACLMLCNALPLLKIVSAKVCSIATAKHLSMSCFQNHHVVSNFASSLFLCRQKSCWKGVHCSDVDRVKRNGHAFVYCRAVVSGPAGQGILKL